MKSTDLITTSDGLSQTLITILNQVNIKTYQDLSKLTRLDLKRLNPRLAVRHLANLEKALTNHKLCFMPDNSIKLDQYINQRKLFLLWHKGVYTYEQLNNLSFEDFVLALGGPKSKLLRSKRVLSKWMKSHGLTIKNPPQLPHLTEKTNKLLFQGNVSNLHELVTKSDFEIAKLLQVGFGTKKNKAGPFTIARLTEIKYALFKEGIERPCMPL